MTATTFVSSADPETHAQLAACFVGGIMAVLQFEERATPEQLSAAAGGLIDTLGALLSCLPSSQTAEGRNRLAFGVAQELEQAMERGRSLTPNVQFPLH